MSEIFIGIVAGFFTALGLGGGTILIIFLDIFKDFSQHTLQGINLIFFVVSAFTATLLNFKNKYIDFDIGKWMIFSGVIGGIIGSICSLKLESKILKKCFGIFLIIIAILEIYSLIKEYTKNKKVNNKIDNTKKEE